MSQCLSTGGVDDPFLTRVLQSIYQANEIELAVSFIKSSGLELLYQALVDALIIRHAKLTVLTSDYLDITDPLALRMLMLLAERGADIHLFQAGSNLSFHLKAYIFLKSREGEVLDGTAYIGSSNISKAAMTDGIEWNYAVNFNDNKNDETTRCFKEIREEYQRLLGHPDIIRLSHDWIDAYEQRRKLPDLPIAPGSTDAELPIPEPNEVQRDALRFLVETRDAGFRRGLVVMATGLGKTFLAAFDSAQLGAKRVLFVAHREEILLQAENTFQRIHPHLRVGQYNGSRKEVDVDLLFASVQTLGKSHHLDNFLPDHFDYIVVDEFHHAAAPTYRKLITHFQPRFLLGLTATPERTDQSDILSLCDDNLVFRCNLFHGVEQKILCPFSYYGIYDESVDYNEIPWRNGRFDPDSLSNKLATLARAKHAYNQWREKAQSRTLAFCVSIKHANFMADRFQKEGVNAVAVYGGSETDRSEALEQLEKSEIQIIFSVDLFNEGVDLPAIDTVMMLRPTESKVLFIQQLGRGLRRHQSKDCLVILDFIGNHRGFLNKPQALFGIEGTNRALSEFAKNVRDGKLELPHGCYVNYDLNIIDFLAGLRGEDVSKDYQTLRDSLGRRPTLSEYYRSGASLQRLRNQYGQWWKLLEEQGDLSALEIKCLHKYKDFFYEIETTRMTKSFKAVLLEAMLEHDGFRQAPTLEELSEWSMEVFRRRRNFISDLSDDFLDVDHINLKKWIKYWKGNPINAWIGGNLKANQNVWFEVVGNRFQPVFTISPNLQEVFSAMLQELVSYRLAAYEPRLAIDTSKSNVLPMTADDTTGTELPYFPELRIACGHFRDGSTDVDEYRRLGVGYGKLDPARHFIARAVGDSMNEGKNPVYDGDYLLLEHLSSAHAGSITGSTVVIERQDISDSDQYLLRRVFKTSDGRYILKATNPDYPDYEANENMRTLARLRAVLDPLDLSVGQEFKRADIPELFGATFNPGNWHSGHVVLKDKKVHVLLVTLNKQGKASEHKYHDYFIDKNHFYWQSQNSTTPENKRGRELIDHEKLGIGIHLFIRENKLANKKSAPFRYYGPVYYKEHEGSAPMNVIWKVLT